MTTIIDGSASATFATPLPVGQGGSGGVSAAAALINLQASVPAFSAYQSVAQNLANGVATKLQFQTKEFDIGTYFDAVTNFRYTPLVAGYYQISGGFQIVTTQTQLTLAVNKNGALYKNLQNAASNISSAAYGSCLVLLNGATDFIELFATQNAAAQNTGAASSQTYFQAVLVKAA